MFLIYGLSFDYIELISLPSTTDLSFTAYISHVETGTW